MDPTLEEINEIVSYLRDDGAQIPDWRNTAEILRWGRDLLGAIDPLLIDGKQPMASVLRCVPVAQRGKFAQGLEQLRLLVGCYTQGNNDSIRRCLQDIASGLESARPRLARTSYAASLFVQGDIVVGDKNYASVSHSVVGSVSAGNNGQAVSGGSQGAPAATGPWTSSPQPDDPARRLAALQLAEADARLKIFAKIVPAGFRWSGGTGELAFHVKNETENRFRVVTALCRWRLDHDALYQWTLAKHVRLLRDPEAYVQHIALEPTIVSLAAPFGFSLQLSSRELQKHFQLAARAAIEGESVVDIPVIDLGRGEVDVCCNSIVTSQEEIRRFEFRWGT